MFDHINFAYISFKIKDGQTALMEAVENENVDIAVYLMTQAYYRYTPDEVSYRSNNQIMFYANYS